MKLTIDGRASGISKTVEVDTAEHVTVGDLLGHLIGLDVIRQAFGEANTAPSDNTTPQGSLFLDDVHLIESAKLDELFDRSDDGGDGVNVTLTFTF